MKTQNKNAANEIGITVDQLDEAFCEDLEETNDGLKDRKMAPESSGLEPLVGRGFIIGSYDDINGADAKLIDFNPTRAELKILAQQYLERHFAVEEFCAASSQTGSFEMRESAFCWRRFESISAALSPEPIPEFEEYIAKRAAEVMAIRTEVEAEMANGPPSDFGPNPMKSEWT